MADEQMKDLDLLENWQVPGDKEPSEVVPDHSKVGCIYYGPADAESVIRVPNLRNVPGVQYEIL